MAWRLNYLQMVGKEYSSPSTFGNLADKAYSKKTYSSLPLKSLGYRFSYNMCAARILLRFHDSSILLFHIIVQKSATIFPANEARVQASIAEVLLT